MQRIASIDYGKKRVGIAFSDILHVTTSPKCVYLNDSDLLKNIKELFMSNSVGLIVLGIPLRSDGKKSKLIEEIEKFKEKLIESTGLEVELYDESFSSQKAVEYMLNSGKKKKFRREKSNIDAFASAIILQDFLNDYGN